MVSPPSKDKRAQGKPDACRTRRPCVQSSRKHASFIHQQVRPVIRLSLHDRLYGLCRFSPGGPSPPVAARTSCDLPSGWTALPSRSLTLLASASPGFAVCLLPRPSNPPVTIALHGIGCPALTTIPGVPAAVGVHRIPGRVRDDREPPLCGPERLNDYTSRESGSTTVLR